MPAPMRQSSLMQWASASSAGLENRSPVTWHRLHPLEAGGRGSHLSSFWSHLSSFWSHLSSFWS
uniref:Uncharacterized protein n=1 Tax=Anguilla anguilla TaxID=7936 RepID=A0A0E9TGH8_ANGAN